MLALLLVGLLIAGCASDDESPRPDKTGKHSVMDAGLDAETGDAARCEACQPIEIASGLFGPQGVVAAAGYLYWTSLDGRIRRCALQDCGTRSEMFYDDVDAREGRYALTALAADDVALYWGRIISTDPVVGGIASCPLTGCGGKATVLNRMTAAVGEIATDQGQLFWTASNSLSGTGGVLSCDRDDCASTSLFLASGQRRPVSVVASSHGLYWTTTSALIKCATPDCADGPQPFATGLDSPFGVAVDDHHVYFTLAKSGQIARCPHESCEEGPEILANGQSFPTAIVLDAEHAFWVNQGANTLDGTVMRCRKQKCVATTLAMAQKSPINLTLNDGRLFWVNVGSKPDLMGGSTMGVSAACSATCSR